MVIVRQYSKTGLALTEQFEGCKLTSYKDGGGVWTIGYGHTSGVYPNMTCTLEQAEKWLGQDVASAVNAVNTFVKVPLNQNQFDALVDFTFNLGSGAFQHSTLLKLLNQGNYAAAANEFPKWDKDNGKVVLGLLRRRFSEQKEYQTVDA